MAVKVEHPNGFSGVFYGKSSMVIYDATGHEVMHTGTRKVNTKEELYLFLSIVPKFINSGSELIKE